MRSAASSELKYVLPALAVAVFATVTGRGADADDQLASCPDRLFLSEPAAPSILGRALGNASHDRPVQSRPREQRGLVVPASASSSNATDDAPPVPMEPDDAVVPAPEPVPATVASPPLSLPVPFRSQSGYRSAFHSRLRAKRMARIQQMRMSAEQSRDAEGAQRAQYLEGMVNQLHQQGLFNFAQKAIGAFQAGKLQLGGEPESLSGSTELPDADLGEAAPLPDTELGEPAPLPTTSPEFPPSPALDDGGDAPPAQ